MASAPGKLVLCTSIIGVVLAIGSAIAITNAMVQLRHTFLLEAADHAGWEQRVSRIVAPVRPRAVTHTVVDRRHKCGRRASNLGGASSKLVALRPFSGGGEFPRGRSELKSR